VIESNRGVREKLGALLTAVGYDPLLVGSARHLIALFQQIKVRAVLLDLKMPGLNLSRVIGGIRKHHPRVSIIALSSVRSARGASAVVRGAIYDYVARPLDSQALLWSLARALERQDLLRQVEDLRSRLNLGEMYASVLGRGEAIRRVLQLVEEAAGTDANVIITGEPGTGKDLIAHIIHQRSRRRDGPFVTLDLLTMPSPLTGAELFGGGAGATSPFCAAHRGILLIKAVPLLPPAIQLRLLQVLREQKLSISGKRDPLALDVRIVVSTRKDLAPELAQGALSRELFDLLNSHSISVPPLRERQEDILSLSQEFLAEARRKFSRPVRGFAPEAFQALLQHDWPGNVRELRKAVYDAAMCCGTSEILPAHLCLPCTEGNLAPSDLCREIQAQLDRGLSLEEMKKSAQARIEREAIRRVLIRTGGNKSQAARILKLDYKTLHCKVKNYALRSVQEIPHNPQTSSPPPPE
jgi:DNA-binding NtrC family response regulator